METRDGYSIHLLIHSCAQYSFAIGDMVAGLFVKTKGGIYSLHACADKLKTFLIAESICTISTVYKMFQGCNFCNSMFPTKPRSQASFPGIISYSYNIAHNTKGVSSHRR